jgi:hypothetical protein
MLERFNNKVFFLNFDGKINFSFFFQPLEQILDTELILAENQGNKQLDVNTPPRKKSNLTHSELTDEWGSSKILQKLSPMWNQAIHPIDMSVLCNKATRLEAAFAFSTLLGKTVCF